MPAPRFRYLTQIAPVLAFGCIANLALGQQAEVQWLSPASGQALDRALADVGAGAQAGAELRLGFGESLELRLEAPLPARSVGVWFLGTPGEAYGELWDGAGQSLGIHPVLIDQDQAPDLVGGERPAGMAQVSGLLHAYEGIAAGLTLTLFGPARLEALAIVWIPPQPVPAFAPPGDGLVEPPADAYPKPLVYSRSTWGANPPNCSASYCNVTHLAVHHSASTADYGVSTWSQAAANVKAIQVYHMASNGWCDIGYNYLIAKQGWIFEGRAGGDDVKGAHDGFNCGSMGVCALGYFHPPYNNLPIATLLNAYAELFAWKCSQKGINPLGSAFYAGFGGSKPTIYGHRDVSATACPGDGLYAQLAALRSSVQQKLTSSGGAAGTLKGVLFNAAIGTSARIAGGTVALGNGQFTTSAVDGYYEFPLPSGSYALGATAPGFAPAASNETVTSGDVWESLGLWPAAGAGAVPTHQLTPLGGNLFSASFQGQPGGPAWLAYNTAPGLPTVPIDTWGQLWPQLAGVQALYLGPVPASGNLTVQLQTPSTPGLLIHTQGLVTWNGLLRFTNGRALKVP